MFHTKSLFPAISLVPQEQRTDQVFRATDFFQDISQNLCKLTFKREYSLRTTQIPKHFIYS